MHFSMFCFFSCKIDWQKGKDVTVKIVKKKQKHKGRGTIRTVSKEIPQDSFFNFFSPVKGKLHRSNKFIIFNLLVEFSSFIISFGFGFPGRRIENRHKL